MFFDGIAPTPPVIPIEYNLSTGCTPDAILPASLIEVGDITLCDITYSIAQEFSTQATLVSYLNLTFLPSFGLIGTFSVVSNELIYITGDDCPGTNCIEILNKQFEDDAFFEFEDGQPYGFEN